MRGQIPTAMPKDGRFGRPTRPVKPIQSWNESQTLPTQRISMRSRSQADATALPCSRSPPWLSLLATRGSGDCAGPVEKACCITAVPKHRPPRSRRAANKSKKAYMARYRIADLILSTHHVLGVCLEPPREGFVMVVGDGGGSGCQSFELISMCFLESFRPFRLCCCFIKVASIVWHRRTSQ